MNLKEALRAPESFSRLDESDDALFYARERLVYHMDERARQTVRRIIGSLIVAHIIGFMETITTTLVAAELRGVFTMLLIIIVLVITPKGLFGREEL